MPKQRICEWCDGAFVPEGRGNFHYCSLGCRHEGKMANDAGYRREQLFARDSGVCAHCGAVDREWQADRIVPACYGGRYALDNMRTLCIPCHKAQTARMRAYYQIGAHWGEGSRKSRPFEPDWEQKA